MTASGAAPAAGFRAPRHGGAAAVTRRPPQVMAPAVAELRRRLRPWRSRLALQVALEALALGVGAGGLLATAVLAGARFAYAPAAPRAALLLGGLAPLAALLIGWLRRPGWMAAARRVDRVLDLRDRVATAWELSGEAGPLVAAQRADALASLARGKPPAQALPLRLQPRRAALAATAVGLALLLAWWPPSDRMRQQAALAVEVTRALQVAEETAQSLRQSQRLTPAQEERLRRQMEQLRAALARRDWDPERGAARAREAINRAAQGLTSLAAADADQRRDALGALADALADQQALPEVARALAGLGAAGDGWRGERARQEPSSGMKADALRRAMEQALAATERMSDAQRRELARQLQRAANAARGDPALAAALQAAGRALAAGDLAEAAADLRDAAARMLGGLAEGELLDQLGTAAGELRAAGERVAAAGRGELSARAAGRPGDRAAIPGDAAQGRPGGVTGATGTNQGGSGQQPGAGQQGTGQQGGSRSGGAGQQPGGGNMRPGGGTGGAGIGSGVGQARASEAGAYDTVFIPGESGQGPSQVTAGPRGESLGGTRVPYQRVVGRYAQAAREHLERTAVPDSMRDAVRRYFEQLTEGAGGGR